MKKAKIFELDALRTLAFFAVAFQHAMAHYIVQPQTTFQDSVLLFLFLYLAKFAVPVFIFITGLVLFYNYDSEFRYFSFLNKRLVDIVVPYLLWSFVYAYAYHDYKGETFSQIGSEIGQFLWTGTASYHTWYIIMILQFYILFPLFRWFLLFFKRKAHHRVVSLVFTVVVLALFGASLWLSDHQSAVADFIHFFNVPFLNEAFTTYADRNFVYFFMYFLLGGIAGLYLDLFTNILKRYTLLWIGVWVTALSVWYFQTISDFSFTPAFSFDLRKTYLLQPGMVVYLLLFIPVIYLFAQYLTVRESHPIFGSMLQLVSAYSYGAYLIHALMLDAAVWVVDRSGIQQLTIKTFIAFIICAALSVLAVWLLHRTWCSLMLTGLKQKRRPRSNLSNVNTPSL